MATKLPNQTDDDFISKLKGLKISDEVIAARLGWPVAKLKERWAAIEATVAANQNNGYEELTKVINMFAMQYQLLGQGLAQMCSGLQDPLTVPQLADLLRECGVQGETSPEQVAENILKRVIVLKKYIPPTPSELFQMAQGG